MGLLYLYMNTALYTDCIKYGEDTASTIQLLSLCIYSTLHGYWNMYVISHVTLIRYIYIYIYIYDRLCGLVVRVSGFRYRGPGFDPRRYQIF